MFIPDHFQRSLVRNAYRKRWLMLSMYGIIFGEIVLGVALMFLLIPPKATAEINSAPSSTSNTELQSERSMTPMQPDQTDLSSTKNQSSNLQSHHARSADSSRPEYWRVSVMGNLTFSVQSNAC